MSNYTRLKDSTEYLGDVSRLSDILQEDGYLFLRRLIDPARVTRVKQDIMAILREHHIIEDDDAAEPTWSGGPHPTETEYMAVYDKIVRLDSFVALAESPEIIVVMKGIVGGAVQVWKQRLIRVFYPDSPLVGTHQDGNPRFAFKARNFYACWLPLMGMDETVGGLALVPESHKRGILDHAETVGSSIEDAKKKNFGLSNLDLTFATIDYHPGDALIFTERTIHNSVPNNSDWIRLSCDFRYQAEGDSVSWIAHTLGPDVRRVAQQLDETIASRALFLTTRATKEILEEVRTRMMGEKSTSLERAQQLVAEVRAQSQS